MVLMLALALASQNWDVIRQEGPVATDIEFTMAVEESIRAEGRDIVPEPFRSMIGHLADDCWKCRELATRQLTEASRNDQRWLMWARKYRDPEIRMRVAMILRKLNPCPDCKGTGESRYSAWPCWKCQGTKTVWHWSLWD